MQKRVWSRWWYIKRMKRPWSKSAAAKTDCFIKTVSLANSDRVKFSTTYNLKRTGIHPQHRLGHTWQKQLQMTESAITSFNSHAIWRYIPTTESAIYRFASCFKIQPIIIWGTPKVATITLTSLKWSLRTTSLSTIEKILTSRPSRKSTLATKSAMRFSRISRGW